MRNWKKLFLKYFDTNHNKEVDWWEWLIPITSILVIEIVAELVASVIIN